MSDVLYFMLAMAPLVGVATAFIAFAGMFIWGVWRAWNDYTPINTPRHDRPEEVVTLADWKLEYEYR